MLAEFLTRLAVALPLVCGLAILVLVAAKRGWIRLPNRPGDSNKAVDEPALQLLTVKAVSPTARLAVVRFAGADHLVGVSAQSMVLLVSAPSAPSLFPCAAPGEPG